jgi:hypothetical protein
VSYCHEVLVDRITCRTEALITPDMDLEAIHAMIVKRAQDARGAGISTKS